MSKLCTNCGATETVDEAVFCNQCGTRLPPAGHLNCRQCGRENTDPLSQFCDRCGSPLAVPEEPLQVPEKDSEPPVIPRIRGPICPACGFENEGENRFYCKQCGAYIRDKSPVRASDAAGGGRRPQPGLIRIKPDGMDAIRKRPVYEPPKAEKQPIARRRSEPPKRTPIPYRKIAIAAVVIIVLIIIAMVVPGLLQEKPDTTAAARSLAAGAPADAAEETPADSPVDSLFKMVQGLLPLGDDVSNQGTAVVKDTSPIP